MSSAFGQALPPSLRFVPSAAGWEPFWLAAADPLATAVREAASASRALAIVVPRGALVAPLQAALRSRLAPPGRTWLPPPIKPFAQWAAELAPLATVDPMLRTMRLLRALDDGTPAAAGARAPADRIAHAQGLLAVMDALTAAQACGRLDEAHRLQIVVDTFGEPAAAQLVRNDLDLLESLAAAITAATAPAPGEAVRLDPVAARRDQAERLVAAWARRRTVVAWLAWQPPDPLDQAFLEALTRALPAGDLMLLEPDWAAVGRCAPVLAASWPESFGAQAPGPGSLQQRRNAWRSAPAGPVPEVLHTTDREREAQLAAQWVHRRLAEWQAAGRLDRAPVQAASPPRLAIVALDRWLARRVRALLERANVLVDDREGWLLSTTVAASAVMGWLDVVATDGYHNDLVAWLDSRFVDLPGDGAVRRWVDRRVRGHRYLRGWRGLLADDPPEAMTRLVEAASRQRQSQTIAAHVEALRGVLELARVPARLQGDEAGRQLLAVLAGIERSVAAGMRSDDHRPIGFGEFRALLAAALERHHFYDSAIASPVEMLTPADAAGCGFDAVLVLGAAEGALPSAPLSLPLLNEPLRLLLGLPTAATQAARQQRDVGLLLALARDSALTCRSDPQDGVQPSPWVERLHAIVGDGALDQRVCLPGTLRRIEPRASRMPALALARLPESLAVGSLDRLLACPFRFLAQDGWRLREPDQPIDVPSTRERGEFVHDVLHRFHEEADRLGLRAEPALHATLGALLRDVTDRLAEVELASSGSYLGEIAEWRAMLDAYVDWLVADGAAGGWKWLEGEQDGAVTVAWQADGRQRTVTIKGRLDRLDGGAAGLRVIDYKLGDPQRLKRLADDPTRAAQLVMYAWIVEARRPVAETAYLSLRRDKVTLMALKQPAGALSAWQRMLPAYLARIDGGEPLAARGAECIHCTARGVCRKGHWQ
jgi:ATP-dependent helicase/nuclease subunit B